jgi:ADP-heptose:LPS heptosyltransferase
MIKNSNKIFLKLSLYLIGHLIFQGITNPKKLFANLSKGVTFIKEEGIKKTYKYVFLIYLPKNYLLKTKISISEPSLSIYKKLFTIFGETNLKTDLKNSGGMSAKQNILVIRSGAMGDVLLATPIIRKLFKNRKGFCSIDIATRNKDIFKNSPYVNQVIHPKELRDLKKSYELILNLDLAQEKNKYVHITDVYNFMAFGSNELDHNLSNKQPELFSSENEITKIEKWSEKFQDGYIVCHNRVDDSQPYRNVPLQDWNTLVNRIVEKTNLPIIQVGSTDMDVAISGHQQLIDCRDAFTLQELKEVIERAKLFLGTDAGPLHVAACTNTPIISFFTIAHHEFRKPLRANSVFHPITPNIDCYGCVKDYPLVWGFDCVRKDNACVNQFNLDKAYEKTLEVLST